MTIPILQTVWMVAVSVFMVCQVIINACVRRSLTAATRASDDRACLKCGSIGTEETR